MTYTATNQPPGANQDVLATLLWSCHVVHLYVELKYQLSHLGFNETTSVQRHILSFGL